MLKQKDREIKGEAGEPTLDYGSKIGILYKKYQYNGGDISFKKCLVYKLGVFFIVNVFEIVANTLALTRDTGYEAFAVG